MSELALVTPNEDTLGFMVGGSKVNEVRSL